MSEEENKIHIPSEDDTFFDKDHIVFYNDESGEIKCKYGLQNGEIFQDLVMAIFGGLIDDGTLNFLIEDLQKQGYDEEAISIAVVKKLLNSSDEGTPIVKPSNFR
jgi:hypothetical protein